jgi:hypothetical protein
MAAAAMARTEAILVNCILNGVELKELVVGRVKCLKVLRMLLEMLMSVDEDFGSEREDDGLFILEGLHQSVEFPDQGHVSLTVRDYSKP